MAGKQTAIDFLRRVLPGDDSYLYSACTLISKNEFKNYPVSSFEDLVDNNVEWSDAGYNTYFGCSAFFQGWHEHKGKKVFRTARNAVSQKSLWLDIDCGRPEGECKNPSVVDAFKDVNKFLNQTGLPIPLIVLSGRGLHLYFTLTESIGKERWLRLAEMLKSVANHFNLADVDQSRTADAASILRLPGTSHYKDGIVRPVKIIVQGVDTPAVEIEGILSGIHKEHSIPPVPVRSRVEIAETDGVRQPNFMRAEAIFSSPLRDPRAIVAGCPQIRDCGLADYPGWYRAMAVLKHCVKGLETMHFLSQQDIGIQSKYDADRLDELWRNCVDSETGPTTCHELDMTTPGVCDRCKHKNRITSPIQLGRIAKVKQSFVAPGPSIQPCEVLSPVYDNAPSIMLEAFQNDDFQVIPGDGVYYNETVAAGRGEDKTFLTTQTKILNIPFYLHHKHIEKVDGQTRTAYAVRLELPGGAKDTLYAIDKCFGNQTTAQWFCNHSATPISAKYNNLVGMCMQSYIATMENKLPVIQLRRHFGWTATNEGGSDDQAFVHGNVMYTQNGKVPINLDERCSYITSRQLSGKGSLEKWKEVPEMYNRLDQKIAQLFICAGFASPFMKFGVGTAKNLVLYIWDIRGGRGKSTLLRAIASIWGHPKDSIGMAHDTMSARYQILAAKRNLPHCYDELTMLRDEEMAEMLYSISNGIERSKSNGSGTGLAETGGWETIVFATSNKSIYEAMERRYPQTPAAAMRVLEVPCDFQSYSGTRKGEYIENTINVMDQNYGLAGPAFLEICFRSPDIFKKVSEAARAWDKKHRKGASERFWTYGLGISLAVGRIAKCFGFFDFDMDELDAYAQDVLAKLRAQIKDKVSSGDNLLSEYLSEVLDSTLIVQMDKRPDEWKDRGTLTYDAVSTDKYISSLPSRKLYARLELREERIFVSCRHLSHWCHSRGASLDAVLKDLEAKGIYKDGNRVQMALGYGVSALNRGRTMSYCFKLTDVNIPDEIKERKKPWA